MVKTKIFVVAGHPVLHSRSPEMFNAAFSALGMDAVYTRLAGSSAEEIIRTAREAGLAGLNVTSPFKKGVVAYLDEVEARARAVNAVNTVVNEGGRLIGYNTDILGVKEALSSRGVEIEGGKGVVVGAGGAARAAVYALLSEGAEVVVANRTEEKARLLAEDFGCRTAGIEELGEELKSAHIVISCLPAYGGRMLIPALRKGLTLLDADYLPGSVLRKTATEQDCTVIDGIEWLLHQAVASFKLFTNIDGPLEVMRMGFRRLRPSGKRNIAFVGFMATGKSSTASLLSEKMGWPLVDTDKSLEERTGRRISAIFHEDGEGEFRRLEKEEVRRIGGKRSTVVSCGGGVVLDQENIKIIKNNSLIIWLHTENNVIHERIRESRDRPLITESEGQLEISRMVEARSGLYAAASDLLVDTGGRGPESVAERIYEELASHNFPGPALDIPPQMILQEGEV